MQEDKQTRCRRSVSQMSIRICITLDWKGEGLCDTFRVHVRACVCVVISRCGPQTETRGEDKFHLSVEND